MAPRVFVSYRRSDDRQTAGRLRDRLADAFGDANVFFDFDLIDSGKDFREAIRSTMAAADAVVLVIGPGFDPDRLAKPNDFVRLELQEAFKQAKLVVPVIIEGASMPRPEQLPAQLKALSYRRAVVVRPDPDFRRDADILVDGIRRAIGAMPESATGPTVEPTPPEQSATTSPTSASPPLDSLYIEQLADALDRDDLSLSDQRNLALALLQLAREDDQRPAAVELLRRLRLHPQVYAGVADQVDAELANLAPVAAPIEGPAAVPVASAGSHVFLSYSRCDQEYVDRLVSAFSERGITCWIDREVDYGTRWTQVIQGKLDTSGVVVVVMTPDAEASAWVGREIDQAEHTGRPILPLLLSGSRFFRLAEIQYENVIAGSLPSERWFASVKKLVESHDA